MPSLYTENSEKWKNLASIDYFTQFVKAWIPFNAWYKNYYPTLKSDREAINAIKAEPNNFRNKLVSLLNNQGNEGVAFKSRIAELHLELERKHLFNKGERINFVSIVIEENPKKTNNFARQTLTYNVERNIGGDHKKVQIDIICRNGNVKFSYRQTNGFNLEDLISQNGFRSLSEPQQNNLKACYEEINPSKRINLLSHEQNNGIPMGNLYFVNNTDHLCKGLIVILYKLRNVLFHGEIIPDSDTNKVYEPAYQILYTLIQAL